MNFIAASTSRSPCRRRTTEPRPPERDAYARLLDKLAELIAGAGFAATLPLQEQLLALPPDPTRCQGLVADFTHVQSIEFEF
ncbi:hypothetical protein [Streptomyces sp. 900116325]